MRPAWPQEEALAPATTSLDRPVETWKPLTDRTLWERNKTVGGKELWQSTNESWWMVTDAITSNTSDNLSDVSAADYIRKEINKKTTTSRRTINPPERREYNNGDFLRSYQMGSSSSRPPSVVPAWWKQQILSWEEKASIMQQQHRAPLLSSHCSVDRTSPLHQRQLRHTVLCSHRCSTDDKAH